MTTDRDRAAAGHPEPHPPPAITAPAPPGRGGYALDNGAPAAARRLASLAALFDPVTFRHIEAVGIAPGWRCWEVGAGGPSVPGWLSSRVGPSGHVLATDIDVSSIVDPHGQPGGGTVEVRRHDVAVEDPPGGDFDLVHARLVLMHVPQRRAALEHMVRALRPGGWLLVEDFDAHLQPLACVDVVTPEQRLANGVRAAFHALLAERGADLELGRRLPRLLRAAGLADVAADAFLPLALTAGASLEATTVGQVREHLIAGGRVTAEEIDTYLLAVASGRLDLTTPPLVSAWGRQLAERTPATEHIPPHRRSGVFTDR